MPADEKKNVSPDEEYQFPQDEYVSSSSEPISDAGDSFGGESAGGAAGGGPKRKLDWKKYLDKLPVLKNKRVMIVIIAVVILFVLVHFLGSKKTPEKTAVVSPSVTTSAPAPTQPVSRPSNFTGLSGSMSSLQEHASRSESQIKDLRGQVTDMQNSLDQAVTTNQQLQQTVQQLSTQVSALTEEMQRVISSVKVPKSRQVVYHLRAVVPDRAWITSGNGETVSVTVGNTVRQYGKVTMIDSVNGIVYTSSGRKIEYGRNDY